MRKLQKLLDEMAAGALLPGLMFMREDLDAILDRRDEEEFETPWFKCSERIQTTWEQASPDAAIRELMDEVRKQSFLSVSRATHQHEMASYVSDDFELISKSIALGLDDANAVELLSLYRREEIPGCEQHPATES
jgi:hypothetical protein